MKIDRILISVDDNQDYIQFLPIVSLAWQKLLGIKPTLAYISKDGKAKDWMKEYCQDIIVYSFPPEIKQGSTATFCGRLLIRYAFGTEEVCMVSDIDMIPLQKEIFQNLPKEFNENNFLSIDYCAFKNGDGSPSDPATKNSNLRKFPSCYTIASSRIWKEIINPQGLSDVDTLRQYYNIRDYDPQEAIINSGYFCDESLMRSLIQRWNPSRDRVIGIERQRVWKSGYFILPSRIDRTFWKEEIENLGKSCLIDAHCPRPLKQYASDIKRLTDFLGIPFIVGGE